MNYHKKVPIVRQRQMIEMVENTFTKHSVAVMRARYWRRSSTGEIGNEGLVRSSISCKAGLASSFFVDETCWISAFIALISFSENDIVECAC